MRLAGWAFLLRAGRHRGESRREHLARATKFPARGISKQRYAELSSWSDFKGFGRNKGSVMKVRRLVLALVALVVFAGSVVPAHAATRHHHKKHHHHKR